MLPTQLSGLDGVASLTRGGLGTGSRGNTGHGAWAKQTGGGSVTGFIVRGWVRTSLNLSAVNYRWEVHLGGIKPGRDW